MDSVLDTVSTLAFLAAGINILLAMGYHYRYAVGPSTATAFLRAGCHWGASGILTVLAALTDDSLSAPSTMMIVIAALLGPVVPVLHLRRIRTERTPTFFDRMALDDVSDRVRTAPDLDLD